MLSREELKQLSKNQLRGHWKIPVLIILLITLIEMAITFIVPSEYFNILSLVVNLILGAYISVATCKFFLKFSENPDSSSFGHLKVPFKSILKAIGVNVIISIPVFITIFIIALITSIGVFVVITSNNILGLNILVVIITLLMIVVFTVISLYFAQTFFILADDENIGCLEGIKRSIKLMKGHKWEFFVLELSFIGWLMLGVITLGIGLLWVIPYMNLTLANYYKEIVSENN